MVKCVKPLNNGVITRSNKLIEARYKLSLHEQKIMYAIISLIQPDDKNFDILRFKVSELAKFCGISPKSAYREIEEVTRTLLTRVLTIHNGKRKRQTHWIQAAEYSNGMVEFELDKKMKPYLLGLKEVFTSMKVSELMSFKSQYSGRIYELLYQQRVFGTRRFHLDKLRDMIGLEKKEYPLFADIRRFIIEPAVKDINKNTFLLVSFETEKEGRKITYITFLIESKPPQAEEGSGSDMLKKQNVNEEITTIFNSDLLSQFNKHRIPIERAKTYIDKYGEEYCKAQLTYFKKRLQSANEGTSKPILNKQKWFEGCVVKNYAGYEKIQGDINCPVCRGLGKVTFDAGEGQTATLNCKCMEVDEL